MGRSNPNEYAENPAQRFFDWQGGEGALVYYDRDKKENVEVDRPFRFLVLEEVMTVGGGFDNDDTFIGYWSNAIKPREAKNEELTVRSTAKGKTRVEMTGKWADIKASLTGAKYIKGLYVGYFNDDDDLTIGYLKIRGAALSAWMEFCKAHKNIYEGAFTITKDTVQKKKGKNTYFEPVFSHTDKLKDETNQAALALDADVLQPYLTEYFAQQGQRAVEQEYSGGDEYSPNMNGDPPDDNEPFDDQF